MHQGKTDKQRKHSMMFAGAAAIGLFTMLMALMIANLMPAATPAHEMQGPPHNYWVPTAEDILYQDSMLHIIKSTQNNMDTINQGMERIILKLDVIIYENGHCDSIRLYEQKHVDAYEDHMDAIGVEKGVMIDPIYNDEYQIWITGNGDTIYE